MVIAQGEGYHWCYADGDHCCGELLLVDFEEFLETGFWWEVGWDGELGEEFVVDYLILLD